MKWQLHDITKMIVSTLLNKYDAFIVIEGNTGTGKSTFAFHVASRVAQEFHRLYMLREDAVEYYYERVGRKMGLTSEEFVLKILKLKEEKRYNFNPQTALVYTQDELQQFLAGWEGISIPDELVNQAFNRDFYSEKQKNIVKMINMFRDHCNLSLACVPSFAVIDNQVKNLTKIKITVKKRGLAIIHTPNKVIYSKDKWDEATNTKIEKEWIIKKLQRPNYSKLTTFRGLVKFPPLSKKQEEQYQQIKNMKRNVVLRDDMGVDQQEADAKNPYNIFYKKLVDGGVRNMDIVRGVAEGMGITLNALHSRITKQLKKENKPHLVSEYLWGKSKKDKETNQEFE